MTSISLLYIPSLDLTRPKIRTQELLLLNFYYSSSFSHLIFFTTTTIFPVIRADKFLGEDWETDLMNG